MEKPFKEQRAATHSLAKEMYRLYLQCEAQVFIKVDDSNFAYAYQKNLEDLRTHFIPEADTPDFPVTDKNRYDVCQLSQRSYPKVLERMTARQAGVWACAKCDSIGWPHTMESVQSVLANLEAEIV